jgi:signal transduction histidine kinase
MNIRYLKALEDKGKIQNEINEIDNLVKESIETLRSTVYNLKELDEDLNLKEEIKELTKKFNELNLVNINFDCSNDINFSSNNIKNVLLSTIKEGITNSLKHGNPSTINISIRLINDNFELILSDNGEGCKFINKSNGLNGITERIKKFSGQVAFSSSINKGFTIKALIPGGFLND